MIKIRSGVECDRMVIDMDNGIGQPSLNPGQDCLRFLRINTICAVTGSKTW